MQDRTGIRLQYQNHFVLFISLLIAPIAAKHGAQRRLNTKNPYAAIGVITCARFPQISVPSSATSANPNKHTECCYYVFFCNKTCNSCHSHLPAFTCFSPSKWSKDPVQLHYRFDARILSLSCSASNIPNCSVYPTEAHKEPKNDC